MKKIRIFLAGILATAVLFSSCDRGFDEINTNEIDPTSLDPAFVMNMSIINSMFRSGNETLGLLTYNFPIVQQMLTPFGTSLLGGNYNQVNRQTADDVWLTFYDGVIKNIVDVVDKTEMDEGRTNLYNAARIWKAYSFMVITDTYGDIPYFSAGRGYLEGITDPEYDSQEAIYTDILNELEEATAALDPAQPTEANDVLFSGNIAQWKRFGNSLLLRAAMRVSEVNPSAAQEYVQKAIAGGLMKSNADNAAVRHSSEYINYLGDHVSGREKANFYIAEPFVEYLKENNDPRLPVFSIRYLGAENGNQQIAEVATSDPDLQVGMPMGYNDNSIADRFSQDGVASLWDYSQGNQTTVLSNQSPEYIVTYSQTLLLLAEAIIKGWAEGEASLVYSDAIRANMEQMAEYGNNAVIEEAAIQNYIQNHPLEMENALEQIHTQYWVSSFLNGHEAWANFRRSDYPSLAPNPYPGSEIASDFILRLVYPDSEYIVNQQNLEAAVSRQGADQLDTAVWWDVD